jgi:serine/threonine-protein kinase
MTHAGTQLGDLVLLDEEPFAEGGTAELYRAQKVGGTGPIVCVKLLYAQLSQDERVVSSLAEEADLAVRLRHPNVVRVHRMGEHEGRYFLVMELVDGPDLDTLVAQHGPLAPDLVAYVGASLARALVYIHHKTRAVPPSSTSTSRRTTCSWTAAAP